MKGAGFIKDIVFLTKNFGLKTAIQVRLLPVFYSVVTNRSYFDYYHAAVLLFYRHLLKDIIEEYKNIDQQTPLIAPMTKNDPIWVCWWQGKENMPELISKCYHSLLKNSNGHPVRFICQHNYKDYIDIPKIIMDKMDEKKISITHFTDILRVSLLAKHGGFWIDGAIWVTKPIDIAGLPFYSPKQIYNGHGLVSKCRWIGGCMASSKNNFLYSFLRDSLLKYWELYNVQMNYLFLDYLMDIAYTEFKNVRDIIDSTKYSCPSLHIMKSIFNDEYKESKMKEILEQNDFLSLTWKKKFAMNTSDGKPTFYKYFLDNV